MAEVIKNLSEGSIELPQVTAPGVVSDKLYNVGGALTFNGTDISAGGGIADVVDDTSPQLGGELDVNDFDIVGSPAADATSAGGGIQIIAADGGATSGAGGAVSIAGGASADYSEYGSNSVSIIGGENTYAGYSYGGSVVIAGGLGDNGGDVNINGGASNNIYDGGSVLLPGENGCLTPIVSTGFPFASSEGTPECIT